MAHPSTRVVDHPRPRWSDRRIAVLVVACSTGGASTAPSAGPERRSAVRGGERGHGQRGPALGETTLGSNESDEVPKTAVQNTVDYCRRRAPP